MVPPIDIGESRLDTNAGFDEAGNLLQAAAKFTVILGAVDRSVWTAFDRLNHLHSFEGSFSLGHELCIRGGRVKVFDDRSDIRIANLELFEIVDHDCTSVAAERAAQFCR